MNRKIILLLTAVIASCTLQPPAQEPITQQPPKGQELCAMTTKSIKLISLGDVTLPMKGRIVMESLYVTKQEWWGRWPNSSTEGVSAHVMRTCNILRKTLHDLSYDCREIYHGDARVWTPREGGGNYGQGVGAAFDELEVIWELNQYYASGYRPKPGTRYIVKNPDNGRAAVLAAGHEVGPASKSLIAGMTPEPSYYLQRRDNTVFTIGEAADQNLPLGPISCQ